MNIEDLKDKIITKKQDNKSKKVSSLLKQQIKSKNKDLNDNSSIVEYIENNVNIKKNSKKNNMKHLFIIYDKDKKRIIEKKAKKLHTTITNIVTSVLNEYILALSTKNTSNINTIVLEKDKDIKNKLVFKKSNVFMNNSSSNQITKKTNIYIKYDKERTNIIEKEAERLNTTKSDIVRVLLDKYIKDIK